MINASARQFQLIIDGLDCSSILVSIDGGYSHYESGHGLITITANIILRRSQVWTEDLDDRRNTRWSRGKTIKIYIANAIGQLSAAPIIGTIYIIHAEYDGIRQLKIEAGCLLSLLKFRTPAGMGICFSFGTSTDLNNIAATLLQKAGVLDFEINITGDPLLIPLPKLTNESLIELFGKLCWSNGYLAYQDNTGIVKTKQISLNPASKLSLQIGIHDIKYERLTGSEQPVELITVTGTKKILYSNSLTIDSVKEIFGSTSIVAGTSPLRTIVERIIEFAPQINSTKRIVSKRTAIDKPLGVLLPEYFPGNYNLTNSEDRHETSYYEIGILQTNCNEPDEGRLIKKEILYYTPYGITLMNFILNQDNVNNASLSTSIARISNLTPFLSKKEETIYRYPPLTPYFTNGTLPPFIPQTIVETQNIYQAEGIVYIDNPSITNDDGTTLRLTSTTTTTWEQSIPSQWKKTTEKREAMATIASDNFSQIQSIWSQNYPNTPLPVDTYFQLTTTQYDVETSLSGQAQPPSPERYPRELLVYEVPIFAQERFPSFCGSTFKERERKYTVDTGMVTSVQQLRNIALFEGAILIGKYKGQTYTIALHDELFSASPLDKINWADNNGNSQSFLIDGLSIAIAQNRFAISGDGIWIGSGNISNPESLTLPYILQNNLVITEVEKITLKHYPYPLDNITLTSFTISEIERIELSTFTLDTTKELIITEKESAIISLLPSLPIINFNISETERLNLVINNPRLLSIIEKESGKIIINNAQDDYLESLALGLDAELTSTDVIEMEIFT